MEKGLSHRINALIIESNVWIALGSAAFATQSYFAFNLQVSPATIWLAALIAFASTFSAYQFHRKFALLRKSGLAEQSGVLVMIFGGLLIALNAWIALDHFASGLVLLPVALLSLYYVMPSRVYPEAPTIRERSGAKIWVIALCWALMGTWFPLSTADSLDLSRVEVWFVLIEKLSFIAGITIPFDVRDLYEDPPALKTIPQRLGTTKSILVGCSLILGSIGLAVVLEAMGWYDPGVLGALIISYLFSIGLVWAAKTPRPRWFYTGVIDGLLLVQPSLIIAVTYFN